MFFLNFYLTKVFISKVGKMNNLLENKEFLNELYKNLNRYPEKYVYNMLKKYIKHNENIINENIENVDLIKKIKNFIENKLKKLSQDDKEDIERRYQEEKLQKMLDRVVRINSIKQDREITNDKLRKQIEMEKKRGSDTKWIEDLIQEDSEININDFNLKKELNPTFWKDYKLNPIIRKGLLKIAKKFIEYNNLQNIDLIDIVFTGSLANKNYNQNSDVDIHIITNYDKISSDNDFVFDYFKTKKDDWSKKHDITIYGYPVEIFVQDNKQNTPWSNTYSLITDKWINKIDLDTKINKQKIKDKSKKIIDKIDSLIKNDEKLSNEHLLDRLNLIVDVIKDMRKKALESGGELHEDNLVFKVLRNSGYLTKISDLKSKLIGKELTINEIFN